MIKLIENLSDDTAKKLIPFFDGTLAGMFTLFSLLDRTSVDGAWVQTCAEDVTALIVKKEMSKVYLAAGENADFYEIGDFISRLGGMVVYCSSEFSEKTGVTAYSKVTLMELVGIKKDGRESVEINDNLRPVFDLLVRSRKDIIAKSEAVARRDLKKFTERAYKEWLSRTSRGIFGGYTTVRAVKVGENSVLSAAVADRLGNTVYIRDVATDTEFRKMGYASDCISSICRDLGSDGTRVFLACNDLQTENFYKKIGFERKEYLDIGIIEL
ncbi:MAG: GNAT family N-acetyltransferase [Ruminococcaceae bacterium]|nr:GNAT family N-acetyltransferase [Oscillospiraceae bacterium]